MKKKISLKYIEKSVIAGSSLHSYVGGMRPLRCKISINNAWNPVAIKNFKENIKYDDNGNILRYDRYPDGTAIMDSLTYNYTTGTNRLASINDAVTNDNAFTGDIDNQTVAANYLYDGNGNQVKDKKEGIDTILWNVYGKIKQVTKGSVVTTFTYDASGNRISIINGKETWYMRDAGGNIMAVYNIGYGSMNGGAVTLSEQNLYGSSRLGIYKPNTKLSGVLNIDLGTPLTGLNSTGYKIGFERGRKNFELVNHLGNVLVTVSDKKIGIDNNNDTLINYYLVDVVSASDYYPGGMQMPGRSYNVSNSAYGFNGKRKDNEIYGEGNFYDYGMRGYDPRGGRFWGVDPLTKKYPWYSPYQFAGNTPIQAIDLDGLEELKSIYFKNVRFVVLKNVTFDFVIRKSTNNLTTEMVSKDAKNRTDYSVNLQMYEPKPGTNPDYYTATTPQPNYRSQGLNNKNGQNIEGRSSPLTFYFSMGNDGAVTAGMGDAPVNSKISFGGGVPIYVNGLKYGEDNIWKSGTPADIAKNTRGAVAPENTKYLLQKSSGTYSGQNDDEKGKSILAYNSKQNLWLIVSQEDGAKGMTLDYIRDKLIREGWDQIIGFDGSSSATLVKDNQTLSKPANYKNNTAPSGVILSVPQQ